MTYGKVIDCSMIYGKVIDCSMITYIHFQLRY